MGAASVISNAIDMDLRRGQIDQKLKQDQQNQQLQQSFAILEVLQHNQERADSLDKESAQLQASHFEAAQKVSTALQNYNLTKKGSQDPQEIQVALDTLTTTQGYLKAIDQRTLDVASRKDQIHSQSDQLTKFMANHALLTDLAAMKQVIPAALAPIQQPQGNYEQPSLSLPSDQQVQDQPAGQKVRPEAIPAPAPMNAQQAQADPMAFQLDLIKRKVDPSATIENGQIVIHAASTDDARRLDRTLQEVKASTPFTMSAAVIDDEGVQNRKAVREDREAMANERQVRADAIEAKSAGMKASQAGETAAPALQESGIATVQDQDGAPHLVSESVDEKGNPRTVAANFHGQPQEQVASTLKAVAESSLSEPSYAKAVSRDASLGIKQYVKEMEAKKDVIRHGKGDEFTVNLFGSDSESALDIARSIDQIAASSKARGVLPKVKPPTAAQAFDQYAAPYFSMKGDGDRRKLVGYMKSMADPKTGKIDSANSKAIVDRIAYEESLKAILPPSRASGQIQFLLDGGVKSALLKLLSADQIARFTLIVSRNPPQGK